MLYDLSFAVPFLVVLTALAAVGVALSLGVLGQSVVRHHRTRVTRHETIPTYYRRLVLAH
jgi:hypothetical protein